MKAISLAATKNAEEKQAREEVREIFARVDQIDERIARRQAEIDRLQADTRRMLDELKVS